MPQERLFPTRDYLDLEPVDAQTPLFAGEPSVVMEEVGHRMLSPIATRIEMVEERVGMVEAISNATDAKALVVETALVEIIRGGALVSAGIPSWVRSTARAAKGSPCCGSRNRSSTARLRSFNGGNAARGWSLPILD